MRNTLLEFFDDGVAEFLIHDTGCSAGRQLMDRLQDVLVAIKPGHVLSVDKVARETGWPQTPLD